MMRQQQLFTNRRHGNSMKNVLFSSNSLVIFLLMFVVVVSQVTADEDVGGSGVCICQPTSYTFELNFVATCEDSDIYSTTTDFEYPPGITKTTCLRTSRTNIPDLVPIIVTSFQIIETNENAEIIQSNVFNEGYFNGDTITYESVANGNGSDLSLVGSITALQALLTGSNLNGDVVINTWTIIFNNTGCVTYPMLTIGSNIGWTVFSGLGEANPNVCPLVTTFSDAPTPFNKVSVAPTPSDIIEVSNAPTKSIPDEVSDAPTSPAPIETTNAPTKSESSSAPTKSIPDETSDAPTSSAPIASDAPTSPAPIETTTSPPTKLVTIETSSDAPTSSAPTPEITNIIVPSATPTPPTMVVSDPPVSMAPSTSVPISLPESDAPTLPVITSANPTSITAQPTNSGGSTLRPTVSPEALDQPSSVPSCSPISIPLPPQPTPTSAITPSERGGRERAGGKKVVDGFNIDQYVIDLARMGGQQQPGGDGRQRQRHQRRLMTGKKPTPVPPTTIVPDCPEL